MYPGGPPDDLQRALEAMVVALERGFWRRVLFGRHADDLADLSAGSVDATAFVVLLRLLAASMEAQALGQLDRAWRLLGQAVGTLPATLTYRDAHSGEYRAAVCGKPAEGGLGGLLCRTAATVWREQVELIELRGNFAPGRQRARAVLVEACVQYLIWLEFDYSAYYSLSADPALVHGDRTSLDRSRHSLLRRATLLRQFADPLAGEVAPPVWQDIGKWRGLRAAANHSLGRRPHPSPCSASAVPVREARTEAWRAARKSLDI